MFAEIQVRKPRAASTTPGMGVKNNNLKIKAVRHSQRGFTLIEMLMAIVIVGIIASVGAPAYRTWIKNLRLESAYQELQGSLLTARSQALTSQNVVILCRTGDVFSDNPSCGANVFGTTDTNADKEWTYGWLVYSGDTPGVDYVSANHDLLAAIHTGVADDNVIVTANTAADEHISYRANGRIDESGPVFAVCDDRDDNSNGFRISFSATGRPIAKRFSSKEFDATPALRTCEP